MMWLTHVLIGGMSAHAVTSLVPITPLTRAAFIGASVVGSLLPDIDEPRSYVGRRVPAVSLAASLLFRHRGATHTLFAAAVVWLLAYLALPGPAPLGALPTAITWGYLSHMLLGDCWTKSGCALLAPFCRKRIKAPITIRTQSEIEYAIQGLLVFGLLHGVFY